jgi:membrane-associated phospholipid phosphatase
MKFLARSAALALALALAWAPVSAAPAGAEEPPSAPYDPAQFIPDLGWAAKTLVADTLFLLTSPLRIDREDLLPLGIGAGALTGAFLLDREIRGEVKRHRDSLKDAAEGISYLGNTGVLVGLNVGLLAVGEGLREYRGDAGVRDAALVSLEAQLLTAAFTVGFQRTLGRSRPRAERGVDHFDPGSDGSFPSAHASQAFAVATVLADRFGWRVGVPAYGLASAVGFSRLALDKHWTSDVVAGAFLGVLVGKALSIRHRTSHGFLDFVPFVEPETRTFGLALRIPLGAGR